MKVIIFSGELGDGLSKGSGGAVLFGCSLEPIEIIIKTMTIAKITNIMIFVPLNTYLSWAQFNVKIKIKTPS